MKISVDWLKDYLDLPVSASELIERLNGLGLMVASRVEREGDFILNVETYANRPDTLGHLGIARELATSLGIPLKRKGWPFADVSGRSSEFVDIQICDEDLCPRYCGVVVRDIRIEPSPEWLKKKMEAMGLKSINNVVDTTNFVLFSTAHPIHAFDLDKISGRKVIVRKARKGERMRTLEGRQVDLSPEMLVIADQGKPMALAGVIGGEDSAVTEETRDIFIESAYFNPVSVRRTRKELGLDTDASYRFERGADISFPPQAAQMAASLLSQFGGKVGEGLVDVYPNPRKNREVILRHRRIAELLGVAVKESFIEKTLTSLGFELESESGGVRLVRIPFFRVDIEREADLIEEIARFYGYDRIPAVIPPLKVVESMTDKNREKVQKIRQAFFSQGFDEVLTFSFSDPEREARFQSGRRPIELRNPVSAKASLLRTTLLGGLLETTSWNKNRETEGVHIFEIGNVYSQEEEACRESLSLAFSTSGRVGRPHWQAAAEEADLFRLKGMVEVLMESLRYEPFSFEKTEHPAFEAEMSLALIYKGENIGGLGAVKRGILDSYSLKGPLFAAEIDLALLLSKQPRPFLYSPVVRYPSVVRDISFLVRSDVSYENIRRAVEKMSLAGLEAFGPVDLYAGPSLPPDRVSLSLRFVYRSAKKTLTAEEVDRVEKKIIGHLKSLFQIQLREGELK